MALAWSCAIRFSVASDFDVSFLALDSKIGNQRRIGRRLREGGTGETERQPEPKQELCRDLHFPLIVPLRQITQSSPVSQQSARTCEIKHEDLRARVPAVPSLLKASPTTRRHTIP